MGRAKKVASPAAAPPPTQGMDTLLLKTIIDGLLSIHDSAANGPALKKKLLARAAQDGDGGVEVAMALSKVCIGLLYRAVSLSAEAIRRHCSFLRDFCKGHREATSSDRIAVYLLTSVKQYAKATQKQVRLLVVTTIAELIPTLDDKIQDNDRITLYDQLTEELKQRMYDTCPVVRERAVASIVSFQQGSKDDEVTANLLMCAMQDPASEVRRQVLRGIQTGNGSKEFLHAYFPTMMRCTQDVTSKPRESAWEALARFKWSHVVFYCRHEGLDVLRYLREGLSDTNTAVAAGCRITMQTWLQRDAGGSCLKMLNDLQLDFRRVTVHLPSAERVATELLQLHRKHTPSKGDNTFVLPYALVTTEDGTTSGGLTFANTLMWKIRCLELCFGRTGDVDDDTTDEATHILPLQQFVEILKDVIMIYARGTGYKPTVAHVVRKATAPAATTSAAADGTATEADAMIPEAEEVLRILLSAFNIYEHCGILSHLDTATRKFCQSLGVIFIVPEADPTRFVTETMHVLRLLTTRHTEAAENVLRETIAILFERCCLVADNGLSFDDIGAYGRHEATRHAELQRLLNKYGPKEPRAVKLQEQIDFDRHSLLKILHVVHAFLATSQRQDKIPGVCSHVIQLGRAQTHPEVRSIATKALTMLCLISPEAVHTYFPLLSREAVRGSVETEDNGVSVVALSGCFDIVAEYGLKFFDAADTASHLHSDRHPSETPGGDSQVDEDAEQRRREAEAQAVGEAIHRRGGSKILWTLPSFLASPSIEQRQVAVLGLCRLLACNRVPAPHAITMLAELFLACIVEPTGRKKPNIPAQQVTKQIQTFFATYSASSPQRQALVANAGIVALSIFLERYQGAAAAGARMAAWIARLTDAATLRFIKSTYLQQDADGGKGTRGPTAAATQPTQGVVESGGGLKEEEGGDDEGVAEIAAEAASAGTRLDSALGNRQVSDARLRDELSRNSLHEHVAMELLVELLDNPSPVAHKIVLSVLPKLRFYSDDRRVISLLLHHSAKLVALTKQGVEEGTADAEALERSETIHNVFVKHLGRASAGSLIPTDKAERDPNGDSTFVCLTTPSSLAQRRELRMRRPETLRNAKRLFVLHPAATTQAELEDVESSASGNTYWGYSEEAWTAQRQWRSLPTPLAAPPAVKTAAPAPKRTSSSTAAPRVKFETAPKRPREEAEIEVDDLLRSSKRSKK